MLSAIHAVVVCLSVRLFVCVCLSHSGIVQQVALLSREQNHAPKRGVVLLTRRIFLCTTVDLEKISPPHAASWDQ